MKIFYLILKIWLVGFIILAPAIVALSRASKIGDAGNELINKGREKC